MKKSYQLIVSYVKQKYFISTIYREASTIEPMWYFETIVCSWNQETRAREEILEIEDSGMFELDALSSHFSIVKKYMELL